MTYRLKHRHEIVWLAEAMTIVTAWKKQRWSNQMVPAKWITGKPGMALVITHLPGGKQQQRFASRAEVAEHFEEETPPEPEHVQGETTHFFGWPPVVWGNLEKALLPRDGFYIEPPEAPKAV